MFSATGVSVRFGGVVALADVGLEVGHGELVGLIGPNGAGKTTFIDAITGFVRCEGNVELDGQRLSRLAPHLRARRGLARTWQTIELFDDLTVRENLAVVATQNADDGRAASNASATDDALASMELEPVADAMPDELTQDERKRVGIARALVARPRLLCLDEPAAGLDARQSEALGVQLRGLADAGTSILLIDHDMGLVLRICDRVVVLDFGRVIAQGPPDQVRDDARVIAAYLGRGGSEPGSAARTFETA